MSIVINRMPQPTVMDLTFEQILLLIAVAIPTILWLRERYRRIMADGIITLDELIAEARAVLARSEEVKDQVEDILDDDESDAETSE